MSTVDRRSRRRDDHFIERCCHPSRAAHTTETALLAALISEHELIARMLDYTDSGVDQILGLLDAHEGAANTLAAWRAASAAMP
jgi:hypothetical protein